MSLFNIQPLRSSFHGELFQPNDNGYNDACKIGNASVKKHPALIARCSGVADTIAAVNFAAKIICSRRSEVAGTTSVVGLFVTMAL